MSHCPGVTLEDWITDWYRLVDDAGDHGSGIRRCYKGQLILTADQFKTLVDIHEDIREHVERVMGDYDEEDHGSWRDYCGSFNVPDEMSEMADDYIKGLRGVVPETPGLLGNT